MAKVPEADVLLPAHQALDVLWRDHLHPLLDRHRRDLHPEKLITHFLANEKGQSLADAFRRAKESLLFGDDDNPWNPNAIQHQVRLTLSALERFILDWSYGRMEVGADELRRQREAFHHARDLVASVRFAFSGGRTSVDAGEPTCRVVLGEWGEHSTIDKKPVQPLASFATHKCVRALIDAKLNDRRNRLTGPELAERAGVRDAEKSMRRLAKVEDWKRVVLLPKGVRGRGYGIA